MFYSHPLKCLCRQNISQWAPTWTRLTLLLQSHYVMQMATQYNKTMSLMVVQPAKRTSNATRKEALLSSPIIAEAKLTVTMRMSATKTSSRISKTGSWSVCLKFRTLNNSNTTLHSTQRQLGQIFRPSEPWAVITKVEAAACTHSTALRVKQTWVMAFRACRGLIKRTIMAVRSTWVRAIECLSMGFSESLTTPWARQYRMVAVITINRTQQVEIKKCGGTTVWCIQVVLMDVQPIATTKSIVRFFSSSNNRLTLFIGWTNASQLMNLHRRRLSKFHTTTRHQCKPSDKTRAYNSMAAIRILAVLKPIRNEDQVVVITIEHFYRRRSRLQN